MVSGDAYTDNGPVRFGFQRKGGRHGSPFLLLAKGYAFRLQNALLTGDV